MVIIVLITVFVTGCIENVTINANPSPTLSNATTTPKQSPLITPVSTSTPTATSPQMVAPMPSALATAIRPQNPRANVQNPQANAYKWNDVWLVDNHCGSHASDGYHFSVAASHAGYITAKFEFLDGKDNIIAVSSIDHTDPDQLIVTNEPQFVVGSIVVTNLPDTTFWRWAHVNTFSVGTVGLKVIDLTCYSSSIPYGTEKVRLTVYEAKYSGASKQAIEIATLTDSNMTFH